MKKRSCILILSLLILVLSSCSHELHLKNRGKYHTSVPSIDKQITVGIRPGASQEAEQRIDSIISGMRSIPNIKVVYPYTATKAGIDYVVEFDIRTAYKGSPTNFFVSWPGFIIFAAAWHGYNYSATITTGVTITNQATGEVAINETYKSKFKCVQSEFDRTWTQIGWFEYSILPFLGGIYYTSYDKDITDDFNYEIADPYGNYIARRTAGLLVSF